MRGELSKDRAGQRVRSNAPKAQRLVSGLLGLIAVVLTVAWASFDPEDPSFLHRLVLPGEPTANLMGRVGAETAAFLWGTMGLGGALIPIYVGSFAIWLGQRNQSRFPASFIVGCCLFLLALPTSLQLVAPAARWSGSSVDSGGALGVVLSSFLASGLAFLGASALAFAGLALGAHLQIRAWLRRKR